VRGGAGGEVPSASLCLSLAVCMSLTKGWQEAERAYLLWKARQVADQQGSGAVAVEGDEEGGGEGGAVGLHGARAQGGPVPGPGGVCGMRGGGKDVWLLVDQIGVMPSLASLCSRCVKGVACGEGYRSRRGGQGGRVSRAVRLYLGGVDRPCQLARP
jgi:hypothetical protein